MENVNLKDLMGEMPYSTRSRYDRELAEYQKNQHPKVIQSIRGDGFIAETLELGPGSHMQTLWNLKGLDKFKGK